VEFVLRTHGSVFFIPSVYQQANTRKKSLFSNWQLYQDHWLYTNISL